MEKSAEAFRTISEVSELLQTPAHVLRFWESRFAQVKPVKRAGGRRYYRPSDLALLGGIKRLLHDDGMTIRGVQKVLREQGVRHVAALSPVELGADNPAPPAAEPAVPRDLFAEPAGGGAKARAAATVTPLWPGAPAPEAAAEGDMLLPDPGDLAEEAPMALDAEEPAAEPFGATLHRIGPERAPADPAAPAADVPQPAATLLRAMDALRARDKRAELAAVYRRLNDLRDRVAQSDRAGRD